jgi:FAD synthetase
MAAMSESEPRHGLSARMLKEIERSRIVGEAFSMEDLACSLDVPLRDLRTELAHVIKRGWVEEVDGELRLTDAGGQLVVVGMIGGVFDILHIGHLRTLQEAQRRCDLLVVVLARSETVERLKGRTPVNTAEDRQEMISALKPVDAAILGDREDRSVPFLQVRPDIVFLGHDQNMPQSVLEVMEKDVEVVRLTVRVEGHATTKLIKKISEQF